MATVRSRVVLNIRLYREVREECLLLTPWQKGEKKNGGNSVRENGERRRNESSKKAAKKAKVKKGKTAEKRVATRESGRARARTLLSAFRAANETTN